jgi:UDP-N-acetylglucosamine 2-epimerase
MRNLEAEDLAGRAEFTGDVMYDAVLHARERARERSDILARLSLQAHRFGVVTLHRAENTTVSRLRAVLAVLNEVAERHLPLVFPVHPRSAALLRSELSDWRPASGLTLIEPLGYLDMLRLVDAARLTLTDSGGLQKEAYFLGCPCITLRTETEWLETVEAGANRVTGVEPETVLAAVKEWLQQPPRPAFGSAASPEPFGSGAAAESIVRAIARMGEGEP